MFYNTNGDDDENAVPSWLKEDDTTNENVPLLGKQPLGKSPSNNKHVTFEEDYGSNPTTGPSTMMDKNFQDDNPTWAEDPSSALGDQVESPDDSDSDEDSSDDENYEDESGNEVEDTQDASIDNWADEKKKKKKKKKSEKPVRNCCHRIFFMFQILAVLANLTMIATQVVPIIVCDIDIVQKVVRGYMAFFSVIFFLTELGVIQAQLLQNWICRGFLYTFLGVVEIEQHVAIEAWVALHRLATIDVYQRKFKVEWMSLFINVSSWWMIGTGCLYFSFGVCCMDKLIKRYHEQYTDQWKKYNGEKNNPPDVDDFHMV